MSPRETARQPIDDLLVGYLLDALDEATLLEVDAYLCSSPTARARLERLRDALLPLESDRATPPAPPGLVTRTLTRVLGKAPALPVAPRLPGRSATPQNRWRRADALVAAVLLVLVAGVVWAWLAKTRQRSDVYACQENLTRFHRALVQYSERRPDGAFPTVDAQGPRAFAGVFIPKLIDAGILTEDVSLTCPTGGRRVPAAEPDQIQALEQWYAEDRPRYNRAVADLAGSYAYSLGFRDAAGLHGLKRGAGMDLMPIIADCPPFVGRSSGGDGNSREHAGSGQNILEVGGTVRFLSSRFVAGDDIYLNEDRCILAGVHESDYVLAASDAAP